MPRKAAAAVPPAVPPAGAPALSPADSTPPAPIEVEFPPDIIALAPPEPEPDVGGGEPASPAPAPPAPVSPPAAPPTGTILAQLDEARRQYRELLTRAQADAARLAPPQEYVYEYQPPADQPDPNTETDLRKVLTTHGSLLGTALGRQLLKQVKEEITQAVTQTRYRLQRERLLGSDADWAERIPEYVEIVRKSGIPRMVAVDEQTDRPLFPEFDPVLYGQLLNHGNPGLVMYKLAKELLGQNAPAAGGPAPGTNGPVAPAPARAAELRARVEAEALARAATRPVGIAALPAAAGSGTRRTITSVKELSDAEQKYLMDQKPDVWQALKRRAIGL